MSDCLRYTGVERRTAKCTMNLNDIPKSGKVDVQAQNQRTVNHVNRHIMIVVAMASKAFKIELALR